MSSDTAHAPIVLAFPGEKQAAEALDVLRRLHATKVVRLEHAAVIERDANGEVSISDTHDLSPEAKRAIISVSALVGFLIGLVWRGIRTGLVVGFAVGQTGAILTTMIDLGFSDVYLKQLAREVQPGHSALVAVADFGSTSVATAIQRQFGEARLLPSHLTSPDDQALAAAISSA